MAAQAFKLNNGRPLLPWQWEGLIDKSTCKAFVGGYGSGKTTGAALAFVENCIKNPWREDYGETNPESLVIGKTDKVIKDSSMKAIRNVAGSGLILKEWRSPGERCFLLINGHVIKFRTWTGSIEGATACGVMLDEAHLLDSAQAFTNYIARMRDPLAVQKRFIIAGIPEFGWLQEMFGPGTTYPDTRVWNISTLDNTYLIESDIERIRASCDSRSVKAYLEGQWVAPTGAIFHEYNTARNLTDEPPTKGAAVDLSVDLGERGACLIAEIKKGYFGKDGSRLAGKRVHVVGQLLPDQKSMEQMMKMVKAEGWQVKPGRSTVFTDPTSDRDELAAVARVFPGVSIIRKRSADQSRNREYGYRAVNTGFLNADGETKLTIYKGIGRHNRGILEAIPAFKRHAVSGKPIKDNRYDHVCDTLRYIAAHHLPLKGRVNA